jgi:uncharacterized protein
MRFWDSSALVPLLVWQHATDRMLALLRSDPAVLAWWGTRVECASAVARLERDGSLAASDATRALGRLTALSGAWQEVQPHDSLREVARRLLRTHELRAADALQLAAAVAASENAPASLDFVCLDARLSLAAEREGFPITG